ncbi:MAG: long-chain fatty acid--CoA ligase, partial [Spirochaetales bacterium]
GLQSIGVQKNAHVVLISDNRKEWLITDLAILSLGAADVPRGCDSTGNEIRYIISYSECTHGVFETLAQYNKVLEDVKEVPLLKTAILFDGWTSEIAEESKKAGITLLSYNDVMQKGEAIGLEKAGDIEKIMETIDSNDIATIIFTSGTTGTPKGVMLTHRNYMAQMEVVHDVLPVKQGDMWLSVLPVWHSFERAVQYFVITLKSGIAYSKTVASIMLEDMAVIKPQWMCGVPRLWEALAQGVFRSMKKEGGIKLAMFRFFVSVGKKYAWAKEHVTGRVCQLKKRSRVLDFFAGIFVFIVLIPLNALGNVLVFKKIRAKLGGNIVAAISGGGALPKETDAFYRAINLNLLEGYGMTESAPVLSVRNCKKPRPDCVGVIYPSANIKILAEKEGNVIDNEPLPPGQKGLIFAKGDQIMKGYYKRDDLTAEIIDEDGWLNTGDLGMLTFDNEIKITGRAKDTIVLLGGENIEPMAIENILNTSDYIETTVVLGQDKKYLGALIVLKKDAITEYAKNKNIVYVQYETLLETPEINALIRSEIEDLITEDAGFRSCDRIYRFALLTESFKVSKELSAKQELMRHQINALYKEQIETLFS